MGVREGIQWRMGNTLVRPQFPLVMGIINATPDSFHVASRHADLKDALHTAENMVAEGATILDIGGASSRPGSTAVPEAVELERVLPVVQSIRKHFPSIVLSIDTWRAAVAKEAVAAGANMVNDISAGRSDPDMLATVARLNVPYIMMHMQGEPRTMQKAPHYTDVLAEVLQFLSQRALAARRSGIADVLVDPGFGFGKNALQNFALLAGLPALCNLGMSVLVGLSRKRMINETLGTLPDEALNGTTVLNTRALHAGASILRVHDVREAVQAVRLMGR
ncbi:MAG: dihydropteroate synthase [Flavobacteriales bacterium]